MVIAIMIRFDQVTVQEGRTPILNRVSFSIGEKERVVFTGPSGSGKTTVLLTIAGVYVPVSGTVWFRGRPISAETIPEVRKTVSFIAQEPILGAETVRESLLLPFTYKSNRNRMPNREEIAGVLDRLGLGSDILDRETAVISGGEKQRIAIARSLLQQKTVFILDEATSALDEQSKVAVLRLFQDNEFTIISASHDRQWMRICTKVYRIRLGTVESAASDSREEQSTP